jgi:hypothetical protein
MIIKNSIRLFNKPIVRKQIATRVLKENSTHYVSDRIVNQFKINENRNIILSEIETSGLFSKNIIDTVSSTTNTYNLDLCQKFIYFNIQKSEIINYIKVYHQKIDKGVLEYVIADLVHRIANESANGITDTHLSQMKSLLDICKENYIKRYSILTDCEGFYLNVIKADKDPSFLPGFIDYIQLCGFKTNDEYFGDILTRYIVTNVTLFNYNDIIFTLPLLNGFKYMGRELWDSIELGVIDKISSLFKSTTFENLCITYDREGTGSRAFWSLMEYHMKQQPYIPRLDYALFNSIIITMKHKYVPEIYQKFERYVKFYVVKEYQSYEKYLDMLGNAKHINPELISKSSIGNVNKIYLFYFENRANELYRVTIKLIETRLISHVDFKAINDDMFKQFETIHPFYINTLNLYFKLSTYDSRFVKLCSNLEITAKSHNFEDTIAELIGFLYHNRNAKNEVYTIALSNLVRLLQESDRKILSPLFKAFPIYTSLIDEDISQNVMKKFLNLQDKLKYESEYKEFEILQKFITSDGNLSRDRANIDELTDFKKLRDLANLSLKEMSDLYKCDFYSAKYESLYSDCHNYKH